jgi:Ca-activated chloride channel family protein
MALSSVSVYALVPPQPRVDAASEWAPAIPLREASTPWRFEIDGTLRVEGRVGHARLASGGNTHLLVEVRGADVEPTSRAPSSLVLVLDRSGSMAGGRLASAIGAAEGMVDRLRDGDTVSVVSFDTSAVVVVPPTTLDARSRSSVAAAIRTIVPGGDTCISCGIERAMTLVPSLDGQIVLLSDGKATDGVRDAFGMERLASQARDRGLDITTVGVGVGYSHELLSVIAARSGGMHHFVENDGALPGLLASAGERFVGTVAGEARVAIDLPEGVELVGVVGRAFERTATGVSVPLGAIGRGETRTVLVEVRAPFAGNGPLPMAHVTVAYRDHVGGGEARVERPLGVEIGEAGEMDPFVLARVEASRSAAALDDANRLYESGQLAEAQRRLAEHGERLRASASAAIASATGDPRAADVAASFDRQIVSNSRAGNDFAGKRHGARPRKKPVDSCRPGDPLCADVDAAVRHNREDAFKAEL